MHDLFGEPIAEPKAQPLARPVVRPVLVVHDHTLTAPRPFKAFRVSPTEIIIWHDLEARPPEFAPKPASRPLDAFGF